MQQYQPSESKDKMLIYAETCDYMVALVLILSHRCMFWNFFISIDQHQLTTEPMSNYKWNCRDVIHSSFPHRFGSQELHLATAFDVAEFSWKV